MSDASSSAPEHTDTGAKFTIEPLVWVRHWNENLMSFRLRRDPLLRFVPGQFARIGLRKEDGEEVWRAYSVVSAPHENELEFFMVVVPHGEFSGRIARLALGDDVLVDRLAQGFLTADRFQSGRDLWLIATGTGLAPYLSMLRDGAVWAQFSTIVVVLSVRHACDLAYSDELSALQDAARNRGRRLAVVRTVTREQTDGALHGRIPALIEDGSVEADAELSLDLEHSRFMLCGNPEMVESMRALLKARGFRMNRRLEPGHIIVENYW